MSRKGRRPYRLLLLPLLGLVAACAGEVAQQPTPSPSAGATTIATVTPSPARCARQVPSARQALGPQCAYIKDLALQVSGTIDGGQPINGSVSEAVINGATARGQKCPGFGNADAQGQPSRSMAVLGYTSDNKLVVFAIVMTAAELPGSGKPETGRSYPTRGAAANVLVTLPGPGRFQAEAREVFEATAGGSITFADPFSGTVNADLVAQSPSTDRLHVAGTWRCA